MNDGAILIVALVAVIIVIAALLSSLNDTQPTYQKPTGHWREYEHKYVYIISNPAWEEWYKVGISSDSHKRVGNYQTGDPYRAYKIEYDHFTPFYDSIEKEIHIQSSQQGVDVRHEWVKAPLEQLIEGVKSLDSQYKEHWEKNMKTNNK